MLLALVLNVQAQDALAEQVLVLEDKAIARFEACLDLAEEQKRWSVWQEHCTTSLAWLQPQLTSMPKAEERSTETAALIIPRSGPATP